MSFYFAEDPNTTHEIRTDICASIMQASTPYVALSDITFPDAYSGIASSPLPLKIRTYGAIGQISQVTQTTLQGETNAFTITPGDYAVPEMAIIPGNLPYFTPGENDTWMITPRTDLAPGLHQASLTVNTVGGNSATCTVSVQVNAVPAGAVVADPIALPDTYEGEPAPAAIPVTITSDANVPVVIQNVSLRDGENFTLTQPFTGTLPAKGDSATACLLAPYDGLPAGDYGDTVVVVYDKGLGTEYATLPFTYTVNPWPVIPPADLNFGAITQGDPAPQPRTLTWTNNTLVDVEIFNLTYIGSDAFELTPGFTGTVHPGDTVQLFTIAPRDDLASAQAPYEGTPTVHYRYGKGDMATPSTARIAVTHAGGTLTPTPMAFPTLTEGETPTALPAMVTNSSTGPLAITGAALQSGAHFTFAPALPPAPLSQGDTVSLGDITPGASLPAGVYADTLVIDYTMGHLTDQATLPITLTVNPAGQTSPLLLDDIDFGTIAEGDPAPAAREAQLTNNSAQPVTIDSVSLTGGDAFTFVPLYLGQSIPAGGSEAIATLTPKDGLAAGSYAATLTVGYTTLSGVFATVTAPVTLTVTGDRFVASGDPYEERVQDKMDYEKAVVVRCKEWVNIRTGPSTSHEIAGRAYLGEGIELLEWNEDGTWCKVIYNDGNNLGWLFHRYIRPVK